MTREQFLTAAGALYDMMQNGGSTLAAPGPTGPSPRFDTRIARKGGMVQWASECSLKELSYWRDMKAKPPSDPKYAESDAKMVKALDYWIAFRRGEPTAQWTGERNHAVVTAKPPSDKPAQYPRDAAPEPPPASSFTYDDGGEAGDDADPLPF